MADSLSELARQISRTAKEAPADDGGFALLTGVIGTWDSVNGYTVAFLGITVSGPIVLASAGTLTPGQTVALLHYKSTVLILGAVSQP